MRCPVLSRNQEIILGDSEEMLQCLEDESVDLVFTSPPYYNSKPEYSSWNDYESYLDDMKTVIHKSGKALKDGHFMIITIAPTIIPRKKRNESSTRIPLHFHISRILEEEGFKFTEDIIWEKPVASVQNYRGNAFQKRRIPMTYHPYPSTEHILVYQKPSRYTVDKIIREKGESMMNVVDNDIEMGEVWHVDPDRVRGHPATFPEEIASRIVKLYSFKGDTVLDPFSGSGTTCMASKKTGRKCIGIEKKKEYHELSLARLRES